MTATEVLDKSKKLLIDRSSEYGAPTRAIDNTVEMLSLMGVDSNRRKVLLTYATNKLVREAETPNLDNIVDCINYLALIVELDSEGRYDAQLKFNKS